MPELPVINTVSLDHSTKMAPHGPALDVSFGIPVLAPTAALWLDDAFMMIGDAAARVRCGENPNDPARTEINDEAIESAANALQDPSLGIGADGRGAVQARSGHAAHLSIAKTNGAMLIYAATEPMTIADGAALDAAVLYVNQAAPATSLARYGGTMEAVVQLMPRLVPCGLEQVAWAARWALDHIDMLHALLV